MRRLLALPVVALVLLLSATTAEVNRILPVIYRVDITPDGSVCAVGPQKVATSSGQLLDWKVFACPPNEAIDRVVGGTHLSPVVVLRDLDKNSYRVARMLPNADPQELWKGGEGAVAFASETVCAIEEHGNVKLTQDGGKTWDKPLNPFMGREDVALLTWLGDRTLIIGGSEASLCMGVLDDDGLRLKWTREFPAESPIYQVLPCGPDRMWALGLKLMCLDLKDGRVLTAVRLGHTVSTVSFIGDRVFGEGLEKLGIWQWNAEACTLAKVCELDVPTAKVVLAGDRTVVVGRDGVLRRLKGEQTEAFAATLQQMWTEKPPDPNVATDAEIKETVQLSLKVDVPTRSRIWGEANKLVELSPRERMLWAREQFKKEIANKQD